MNLLVVDDHAVVREGLKRALSQEGFDSIDEADCVSTARAKISALAPDVAVIDINLPEGTGFELVRWIRSYSKSIGIVWQHGGCHSPWPWTPSRCWATAGRPAAQDRRRALPQRDSPAHRGQPRCPDVAPIRPHNGPSYQQHRPIRHE